MSSKLKICFALPLLPYDKAAQLKITLKATFIISLTQEEPKMTARDRASHKIVNKLLQIQLSLLITISWVHYNK